MNVPSDPWLWLTTQASAAWQWIQDLASAFWDWLGDPQIAGNFWPALLAGILVLFIAWLAKRLLDGLSRLPSLFGSLLGRRRDAMELALDDYRAALSAHSLKLHHTWMKEGQTLGDIIVPVSVERGGDSGGIDGLSATLTGIFSEAAGSAAARAPRVVVIGGPGSGKSVALRLLARDGWDLPRPACEAHRVPVLMTFAELRKAGFELVPAIARALAGHGLKALPGQPGAGAIDAWIRAALDAGRLLVLIDALDELDLAQRAAAVEALGHALRAWGRAPFVVSCRSAAWHDQIQDPARVLVRMAPFPPAAIRRFVHRWHFEPPKSAGELHRVIQRQPHVADLARNPLMLTIVCFLYSQPKYRLPDNRAQFYEVCSLALLEHWDQAQSRERANAFDRPHKEHLLAALALEHIAGPRPDQDLDEGDVLALLADEMEGRVGLRRAENHRLLEELIQNSGLLVRLPPRGLRFPHQTFMEYFAAKRLLDTEAAQAMLARYDADPGRWREVLLLYCGLCPRAETLAGILAHLRGRGEIALALTALSEARIADPAAAADVLDAAEAALATSAPPADEIVASLGYLAANPLTSYGQRAAGLLDGLLRERGPDLPPDSLQALLLAALRRPAAELTGFVVANLERLRLGQILPAMAEDALVVSAGVLHAPEIPVAKKLEWIDGLRRAQVVAPLLALERLPWLDAGLHEAVAVALARCSTLEDFWTLADEEPDAPADVDADAEEVFRRWGWPYEPPLTDHGRRLCCRLALALGREVTKERMEGVHPRLQYLACALAVERGEGSGWDWEPAEEIATGRPRTLRAVWRRASDARWGRWVGEQREFGPAIIGTAYFAFNALLTFLLGASTVSGLVGRGDLGVPWPPLVSLALLAIAAGAGALLWWLDKDPPLEGVAAGAVFPVWLVFGLVSEGIARVIEQDWRRRTVLRDDRAGIARSTLIASALCILPLLTLSPGILLQVILYALLVLNPVFFLTVADFATSPLAPSDVTRKLFSLLRRDREDDPEAPRRSPGVEPKAQ